MTDSEQKANIQTVGTESDRGLTGTEGLQHLKRVSRVKHLILQKYFAPWAKILGSANSKLAYVDCFAGPGQYEMDNTPVEGSPVIAVREAVRLLQSGHVKSLSLHLVDDEPKHIESLKSRLEELERYPSNLDVNVKYADSRSFVPDLLKHLGSELPTFFLIDPYGHPLPLSTIRTILRRQRTEALINLMWFQINRDLNNPKVESRLNELFGTNDWRNAPFIHMHGPEREKAFLAYFISQLGATYVLPFRIRYDVEDIQRGHRTKYYLLHASNHAKAVLLMKEVMWPLGDEEGTFEYSGESQGILISSTPTLDELENVLSREFRGQELGFDELRERTWILPFVEKHYREVLKRLDGKGRVAIHRITSKKTGISGQDRIRFK